MQKIFVCEFITCGGMRNREIPAILLADAELMLQALLADLSQIPGLCVHTCRDDRLPPLKESSRQIGDSDDVEKIWAELMRESELVWVIAPETDNELLKLNRLTQSCGVRLLSSSEEAIRLTSSKMTTYKTLHRFGYQQPETRFLDDEPVSSDSGWIVKPNSGAGGEHCYFYPSLQQFKQRRIARESGKDFIQQPFLQGIHASLSLVYTRDKVVLLSCNQQEIFIENNQLFNRVINHSAVPGQLDNLQKLAENVREHIPGLRGYIGIDLIVTDAGVYILDINPRLTSSYAGLSESVGYNVADFIIKEFSHGQPLNRESAS